MIYKTPCHILYGFIIFVFGLGVIYQPVRAQTPHEKAKAFRFHLSSEPGSMNPTVSDNTVSGYLLTAVFEGLFKYHNGKGLIPAGASSCQWEGQKKLTCELNRNKLWSDGSPVTSADYIHAFQKLVDPLNRSKEADQFIALQNARKIIGGTVPVRELGIKAPDPFTLIFYFDEPDAEFTHRLVHSVLVPMKAGLPDSVYQRENISKAVFNGPYKIREWVKGKKLILDPNALYKSGHPDRPPVEILFVDDDTTALQLYEQGTLSFQRRLLSVDVARYKKSPDFLQVPVSRFDYFGFNASLPGLQDKNVRRALSEAIDYDHSKAIFDSKGRFGCAGLPLSWASERHCLSFKQHPVSAGTRIELDRMGEQPPRFVYSQQGGDDNRRTAEWLQAQWKKNLGLSVSVESREQKVFLAEIKAKTPALFLKRMGLDRPSCLAALENFESGSGSNFIRFRSRKFDRLLAAMRTPGLKEAKRKGLCEEGLKILIQDENALIPTGRFDLTMLMNPKARGWSINEMNQLDLSQLHWEVP